MWGGRREIVGGGLRPVVLTKANDSINGDIVTTTLYHVFGRSNCQPTPFGTRGVTLGSCTAPRKLRVKHTRTMRTRTTKIPYRASVGPLLLGPDSSRASRIMLGNHPVNGHGTFRCFHGRKHRRLERRMGTTFSHLTTHCGPVMVRKTKDVSRVGLQSASLIGVPVTYCTSTSIVLMTSVSQKKMFTDICNSIVLRAPRSGGHVGKMVVGGFEKSVHLFRPNIGVVRSLYNVPILKVVPCCEGVRVRRRSSMNLSCGQVRTIRNGVGVTIILLHRLSGFASFGELRQSRQIRLCCAGGARSLTGTSVVLLPNDGDALSSLCRLEQGKITRTILHTRERKIAMVKVYKKCRLVKLRVRSPRKIRKRVHRLPKLKLLPIVAAVRKRGIAQRIGFRFLRGTRAYRKCRVRVKRAHPIPKISIIPLGGLRSNKRSNYFMGRGYVKDCVRKVLSGRTFVSCLLRPCTRGLRYRAILSCQACGRRRCSGLTRRMHDRLGLPLLCRVVDKGS